MTTLADGRYITFCTRPLTGARSHLRAYELFGFIEVAFESGLARDPVIQVVIDIRDPVALDLL